MSDPVNPSRRIAAIAGVVVALHVVALWALQSGLLRRVVEVVVPVQILSVAIAPEVPKVLPVTPLPVPPRLVKPPPAPARPAAPPAAAVAPRPLAAPVPQPAPLPMAVADAAPMPAAPAGVLAPQGAPSGTPLAGAANTGAAPGAPAGPKVELPSSDADYLNNPKPRYPLMSKRAGEQGRVLVRVLIGADGQPQKADVKTSSGFERLDQAAVATVLTWRYVPGKRAGVAEAMWFNVPIYFVLE